MTRQRKLLFREIEEINERNVAQEKWKGMRWNIIEIESNMIKVRMRKIMVGVWKNALRLIQ